MEDFNFEDMLEHRRHFIEVLSQYYPIPTPWLSQYADVWDWNALSSNIALAWDEAMLEEHVDRWNWSYARGLYRNPALPWSASLIRKYVGLGKWDWEELKRQPKILESAEMVALCLPHWSTGAGSTPPPRSEVSPECYWGIEHEPWGADADRWAPAVVASSPGLRWGPFSTMTGFPWSAEFIEAHADKLDWKRLSHNSGLPWSIDFIRRFEDRWDWSWMTSHLPWSLELLEAFEHRLDWERLCSFDEIPWTEAWLDRFADKVTWARLGYENGWWSGDIEGLLNHPGFRWTPETFARHRLNIEAQFRRLAEQDERDEGLADLALEYWTYHCDTTNWTPEFVELLQELERTGEIDRPTINRERLWAKAPINPHFPRVNRLDEPADRRSEHERKQADLTARLDDATVQNFLNTLVKDRRAAAARNLELEAAIARDLEQRDNYEVYADWLFERGDPHAGLIRSMLDPSEPFDAREFGKDRLYFSRDLPHVEAYERFIEFKRNGVLWRRGFVRAVWGRQDDWRRLPSLRAFRFLEVLHLGEYLHTPVDDAALELLRPLDCLAKVSVQNSRIYKPAALANLPALMDLRLDHSTLTDLSPLAALQHLRRLSVWNSRVHDLGPLAELPNLRWLHIGHGPVRDLSPLSTCRNLVELDLRFTRISDLSPLRDLRSLRRIFVENSAVDDAQIGALREALPELEFCRYAGFWRGEGDVGPFFTPSDC